MQFSTKNRPQSASSARSASNTQSLSEFNSSKKSSSPALIKKKIVDNNIRGKKVEAITAEYLKAAPPEFKSTYQVEIAKHKANDRPKTAAPKSNWDTQPKSQKNEKPDPTVNNYNGYTDEKKKSGSTKLLRPASAGTQSQREMKKTSELNKSQQSDTTSKAASTHRFGNNHPLGQTLNSIVDENAEYFNHIAGNCHCATCKCGKHKCKITSLRLKQKGPGLSVYAKDYPGYTNVPEILKMDFQTTFKSKLPMDFGTTHKTEFKAWEPSPTKRLDDKRTIVNIPFAGKSHYRGEYINWGKNASDITPPLKFTTIIPELPFHSETTYGAHFAHPAGDDQGDEGANPYRNTQKPFVPKNNKSPLSPGIPFLGETTTMKDFKPFKVGANPSMKPNHDYTPTEAYPGQYKSHYGHHFEKPHEDHHVCPVIKKLNLMSIFNKN